MSVQQLNVTVLNALKSDALDKMKSILKADFLKADKEKLLIKVNKNTYLVYFKKNSISIKNQNKAGDFSFPHIDKTREKQLVALWEQVQSFSYAAAKIYNLSDAEFKRITTPKTQQQELL